MCSHSHAGPPSLPSPSLLPFIFLVPARSFLDAEVARLKDDFRLKTAAAEQLKVCPDATPFTQAMPLSTYSTDLICFGLAPRTFVFGCLRDSARSQVKVDEVSAQLAAAQSLLQKLDGERSRWAAQVAAMNEDLGRLPLRSLLAAAFTTYLCSFPEDERAATMRKWLALVQDVRSGRVLKRRRREGGRGKG